jgi:hypothetical protein
MFCPELTRPVESGFLNPRYILLSWPGLRALPEPDTVSTLPVGDGATIFAAMRPGKARW